MNLSRTKATGLKFTRWAEVGCTALLIPLLIQGCGDSSPGSNNNGDRDAAPDDSTVTVPEGGTDAGEDGAVVQSCLPEDTHGGLLYDRSDIGFRLFEGCGGDHLWERHGGVLATPDDIIAIRAAHDNEFMAIPGIQGVGRGLCCSDSGSAHQCIHFFLQSHTTMVEELAEHLEQILGHTDDLCVGFTVTVIGSEDPRCQEHDPLCVPIPMCPQVTDPTCCPVAPTYDPQGNRDPATNTFPALGFLSDGGCNHDGECVLNGCGQYCNAYTIPGFIGTCECYPDLAEAFCGCVNSTCQWFFQ